VFVGVGLILPALLFIGATLGKFVAFVFWDCVGANSDSAGLIDPVAALFANGAAGEAMSALGLMKPKGESCGFVVVDTAGVDAAK
jgi:hypothetical protein